MPILDHDYDTDSQLVEGVRLEGRPVSLDRDIDRLRRAETAFLDMIDQLYQTDTKITCDILEQGAGINILGVRVQDDPSVVHLLRVGESSDLKQEVERYSKYVEPILTHDLVPQVTLVTQDNWLGILQVKLPEPMSYDSVRAYCIKHDVTRCIAMLTNFFQEVCFDWYKNRHQSPEQTELKSNYLQHLGLNSGRLRWVMKHVNSDWQDKTHITIDINGDAQTFPSAIESLESLTLQIPDLYLTIGHGNPLAHNIVVSDTGLPMMINFGHVGISHALQDIALIEAEIRTGLLDEALPLETRLQFEKHLLHAPHVYPDDGISALHPSVTKCLQIIRFIHQTIYNMTYPTFNQAYYLLALAMGNLWIYSQSRYDTRIRQHAFLAASILLDTDILRKHHNSKEE